MHALIAGKPNLYVLTVAREPAKRPSSRNFSGEDFLAFQR
jgi:hypothetical protein